MKTDHLSWLPIVCDMNNQKKVVVGGQLFIKMLQTKEKKSAMKWYGHYVWMTDNLMMLSYNPARGTDLDPSLWMQLPICKKSRRLRKRLREYKITQT